MAKRSANSKSYAGFIQPPYVPGVNMGDFLFKLLCTDVGGGKKDLVALAPDH